LLLERRWDFDEGNLTVGNLCLVNPKLEILPRQLEIFLSKPNS
jgi:hypothetical protein